jgi:hypothetical protein
MMQLPAFAKAWKEIRSRPAAQFLGFRRLEELDFESDPLTW